MAAPHSSAGLRCIECGTQGFYLRMRSASPNTAHAREQALWARSHQRIAARCCPLSIVNTSFNHICLPHVLARLDHLLQREAHMTTALRHQCPKTNLYPSIALVKTICRRQKGEQRFTGAFEASNYLPILRHRSKRRHRFIWQCIQTLILRTSKDIPSAQTMKHTQHVKMNLNSTSANNAMIHSPWQTESHFSGQAQTDVPQKHGYVLLDDIC